MKVKHFHHQLYTTLNRPSILMLTLRHWKILINTLLRWCSFSIIASYMLTVTAGIRLCNQFAMSSTWMQDIATGVFLFLFLSLLYIQNKYSERKTESIPVNDNGTQLSPFYLQRHFTTNKKRIAGYVTITLVVWLIMSANIFSHFQTTITFLMISGLMLYGFGLFMIRNLLKEKCMIRQMICKAKRFKMDIDTTR